MLNFEHLKTYTKYVLPCPFQISKYATGCRNQLDSGVLTFVATMWNSLRDNSPLLSANKCKLKIHHFSSR